VSRRAAIDIGTNSVRLLVADVIDSEPVRPRSQPQVPAPPGPSSPSLHSPVSPVLRRLTITRLGEHLDATGLIQPAAAARTAAAVEEFIPLAVASGAPVPLVVGTYALRVARNPQELLARLTVPARVLSGDEEARLGYEGALAGFAWPPPAGPFLVLDIGGGSVELTWGAGAQVAGTLSLPLGAVVLTEEYLSHDPPTAGEIEALRAALGRDLRPRLAAMTVHGTQVLGVGGTITTMAALAQRLDPYDPDRVHGFRLRRLTVEEITGRLAELPVAGRRRLPGLQPERADIIAAGALVLQYVMTELGCPEIIVSEADLLWALVLNPTAYAPRSGS